MDFDVIIIGGGPAGVTAAIYAERAGLKPLILEKMFVGGQVVNTSEVENYPGLGLIGGTELAMAFDADMKRFPDITFKREEVLELSLEGETKQVTTKKGTYTAHTVILTMGAKPRYLEVEGEQTFAGRGVSYCGTCDGALYRGKQVLVAGGGNTAVEDAIFLSRLCEHVHIVHRRDTFRAGKKMVENMLKIPNITIHYDSTVETIKGETAVNEVVIKNKNTGDLTNVPADCIFIAVGQIPSNDLVKDKVELDAFGYIKTDEHMATNVSGVFAAGDGRANVLKQIITAAGEGAIAAYSASLYMANL